MTTHASNSNAKPSIARYPAQDQSKQKEQLLQNVHPIPKDYQEKQINLSHKNIDKNHQIRNIVEQLQGQEYKEGKPFNTKFTQAKRQSLSRNQIHQNQVQDSIQEKNSLQKQAFSGPRISSKTKDLFTKKLESNKIKDENSETPSSTKNDFRIKKVKGVGQSGQSPSKQRQQLMRINEKQRQAQLQILGLHNKSKQELQAMKKKYQLHYNNPQKYLSEISKTSHEISEPNQQTDPFQGKIDRNYEAIKLIDQKLKRKSKEITKNFNKIQENAFLQFINNLPEDIFEANSSQEADQVEQLPIENQRQVISNSQNGSYLNVMPEIKNKKYGLNLRRTYDIFSLNEPPIENTKKEFNQASQEQIHKENGQNKVTVNNRLKDFLLN